MLIKSAKDLLVYKKAYALAMEVFQISQEVGAMLGKIINDPIPFLIKKPTL